MARRRAMGAMGAGMVALCLVAAGCGSSGGGSASKPTTTVRRTTTTEATTTTAAITTTTVPEPTIGDVFYSDEFTDATKGWPVVDQDDQMTTLHTDYSPPQYDIVIKKANLAVLPHPEFRGITPAQLRDYAVTAKIQTTLKVGSNDFFGVTCRDLHDARYEFEMSKDTSEDKGSWAIEKSDSSGRHVLAKGSLQVGGSAFDITGICTGGHDGDPAQLTLQVNGETVGSATDDESPLEEGYGGIYADTDHVNAAYNVLGFQVATAS